jgi:hypothetical protein
MLDLFLAADAVIGNVLSQEDVTKLRELLATGKVEVRVTCLMNQHGAAEVIGTVARADSDPLTLFHLHRGEGAARESKRIIEPGAFTHTL